jgi:hypothetical protein
MKTKFVNLFLMIFLLQACCPDCEKCNPCPNSNSTAFDLCDSLEAVNLVRFDTAFKYIDEGWKDSLCIQNAVNNGMAAFFKTSDVTALIDQNMKDGLPYKGLLYVPAIEETDKKGNLYFAFKLDTLCPGKPNGYRPITAGDKFKRSSVNIPAVRRPEVQVPPGNAKDFLDGLKLPPGSTATLDDANTKKLLKDNFNYKLFFSDESNYADFGYGFIQEKYFKKFLKQNNPNPDQEDIKGYWVVLGLNKENSVEYVRMVFFPTDNSGKILPNGLCLEKSWPPIDPSKK